MTLAVVVLLGCRMFCSGFFMTLVLCSVAGTCEGTFQSEVSIAKSHLE